MKKGIIVYDFDKTLYSGETATDFFFFYFKKHKMKSLVFLFKYFKYILLYLLKKIDLTKMKGIFFSFLEGHTYIEIEEMVNDFWKCNKRRFYNWIEEELEENKKETDRIVVISASPRFLIESKLKKIGYTDVIGTEMKNVDGKFIAEIVGKNCKKEEKVKRLNDWAENEGINYEIIKFYSDSIADKPLFDLAKEKIWIKNGKKIVGKMPKKKWIEKIVF